MRTIAVILAGGSGTRFGGDVPKQYLEVNGREVIEYTIDAFHSHPLIDEVCVVCHPDYIAEVQQIVADNHYNKVRQVIAGGKERYHSSLAALKVYTGDSDLLFFHDAVRPLVSERIITECVETLKSGYGAVTVAIPTTDTIYQVDDSQRIIAIPQRSNLRNAQTPQGFRADLIRRAYALALADPSFVTTDDCGVVHHYLPDVPIHVVPGDSRNIKITYPGDLEALRL